MRTLASALAQGRLVTFFALAIAFSWLNVALAAVWPGIPFLFPYGPLLAALIVAAATSGRSGLKNLAARCLRWRVSGRWYAAAILTPVALALAASALNVLLGATAPDLSQLGPWYRPLLLLPEVLLDAPLGEETGWRGFALPLLPAGNMALSSSLVLGALIAVWHFPIALQAPALAPYLLGTIASAILANWVYYNARESALLVIVYHAIQNTAGGWLLFSLFGGADLVRLWWLWCALYWLAAIVVVLIYGPTLTRRADTHGKRADATDAPQYA